MRGLLVVLRCNGARTMLEFPAFLHQILGRDDKLNNMVLAHRFNVNAT
jgi:hypothetical protein